MLQSISPQSLCVQLYNLSEPLSLNVHLEYNGTKTTLFEESVTENNFFKCNEFEVFHILIQFKRDKAGIIPPTAQIDSTLEEQGEKGSRRIGMGNKKQNVGYVYTEAGSIIPNLRRQTHSRSD